MNIRDHIAGFAFVFGVAVLTYYLSADHRSFDAQAVSLVIGMLAGNMIGHEGLFKRGGETALRIFLPVGVALYCSQMSFSEFGWRLLPAILPVICGLFILAMLLAVIFNVKRKVGVPRPSQRRDCPILFFRAFLMVYLLSMAAVGSFSVKKAFEKMTGVPAPEAE